MLRHWALMAVLVAAIVFAPGCSRSRAPKKEPTYPVSGVIHIDGKPAAGVRVWMFPLDKPPEILELNRGAPHWGITDADGKFKITTYDAGDGAPEGEYMLVFHWEGNPKVLPFSNPDEPPVDPIAMKFNQKYFTAINSPHKVTVEKGKGADVGTLELTTK